MPRGPFHSIDAADGGLEALCFRVLGDLSRKGEAEFVAALADPRDMHRTLYCDLAPADAPEMAGNFRGSDFASLRDVIVFYAFNANEGATAIAGPHRAPELMLEYAALVREHGLRRFATVDETLLMAAAIMSFFGVIHPFVYGNGHVQRITVQSLLGRAGLVMAPAWRPHPCPYGEDMHRALAARDVPAIAARLKGFVA